MVTGTGYARAAGIGLGLFLLLVVFAKLVDSHDWRGIDTPRRPAAPIVLAEPTAAELLHGNPALVGKHEWWGNITMGQLPCGDESSPYRDPNFPDVAWCIYGHRFRLVEGTIMPYPR